MLDKARERGIYDDLVAADLIAHLASREAAFDVVNAADVFVYIGDVAPVFAAAARSLRARAAGLAVVSREEETLRTEHGKPARALLCVLQLPLPAGGTAPETSAPSPL